MSKSRAKNIATRVVRKWSQKLLVTICLIHHQWICSWLKVHIFHFLVFGPLKEHFCMTCFNTDMQVQLDSSVWPSWLNRGSYCQDVYNPITRWDKYHNRQGYFVVGCMNVFLHSWNASSLTKFMVYFSELHLTYVYVLHYMSAHPKLQSSW
jgi:hypothetical protein